MFCGNCGRQNPDDGTFCTSCGSRLYHIQADPRPQPAPVASPAYAPAGRSDAEQQWEHRFQTGMKSFASCPLVLFASIFFTVTVVLNLMQIYESDLLYQLEDLFRLLDLDLFSDLEGVMFACMLPSILMAISLWITYASGFSGVGRNVSTVGLSIIRWILTATAVVLILCGAVVMIAFLVVLGGLNELEGVVIVEVFGSVYLALCVVSLLLGLMIPFYIKLAHLLQDICDSIHYGVPDSDVSGFLPGMFIFLSVVSLLGMLVSGFTVTGIVGLVNKAIFAALLYAYRDHIQNLGMEYAAHRAKADTAMAHRGLPAWKRMAMENGYTEQWSRSEEPEPRQEERLPAWKRVELAQKEKWDNEMGIRQK